MEIRKMVCISFVGFLLISFVAVALNTWDFKFDDAFISYRYSKHWALGYGLRWNIAEPPTEGYTNFLLVLCLAPLVKLGFDPLTATRVLSYFAVAGTFILIFNFGRRHFPLSSPVPWVAASLILMVPETKENCLTGLETSIYSYLLLLTFITGYEALLDPQKRKNIFSFALYSFATFLTRPEGILVCPLFFVFYFFETRKSKQGLKNLLSSVLILVALSIVYFGWKYWYFGSLLPNPFYVKAAEGTWFRPWGYISVRTYILQRSHYFLIFLAVAGLLSSFLSTDASLKSCRPLIALCLSFTGIYFLFFLRVDTLMDISGRFLYPVTSILVISTLPLLAKCFKELPESLSQSGLFIVAILLGLSCVMQGRQSLDVMALGRNLMRAKSGHANSGLMYKENEVAQKLSKFENIRQTRIAFFDSGIIPYYTDSVWLDTVGLNDPFIARQRNLEKLAEYVFNWNPDLIILPGFRNGLWINYDHGPLVNVRRWAHFKQFDKFDYVGTTRTDFYDLQYFVRQQSQNGEKLKNFLKREVVDGFYLAPPFDLGTKKGAKQGLETWKGNAS
jgi:hypothetical protein